MWRLLQKTIVSQQNIFIDNKILLLLVPENSESLHAACFSMLVYGMTS